MPGQLPVSCNSLAVLAGKSEVLGSHLISVAPHHSLLQWHLGSPESLFAHCLFLQGGGKVGRQGGHPVKALAGVGVETRLTSAQYVQVPYSAIGSQIGPIVGRSQVFGNSDLVDSFHIVGNGLHCGRRRWSLGGRGLLRAAACCRLSCGLSGQISLGRGSGSSHHLNHHLPLQFHGYFPFHLHRYFPFYFHGYFLDHFHRPGTAQQGAPNQDQGQEGKQTNRHRHS